MIYGLIISAGNQKRFDSKKPKALLDTPTGETLLELNMTNMHEVCDLVYVVCSTQNQSWFDTPDKIVIESGKGCGDAVMKALQQLPLQPRDTVFIQWGDSYQKVSLYRLLLEAYIGKFLIPCQREDNPYVCIVPERRGVEVYFSKYGETCPSGYHDLSLFYGNAMELLSYLEEFRDLIEKDGNYIHKHGNEMQFLDVFNETIMPAHVCEVSDYQGFSFNTKDEFKNIIDKFDFSN